jgi:hypothetical protein
MEEKKDKCDTLPTKIGGGSMCVGGGHDHHSNDNNNNNNNSDSNNNTNSNSDKSTVFTTLKPGTSEFTQAQLKFIESNTVGKPTTRKIAELSVSRFNGTTEDTTPVQLSQRDKLIADRCYLEQRKKIIEILATGPDGVTIDPKFCRMFQPLPKPVPKERNKERKFIIEYDVTEPGIKTNKNIKGKTNVVFIPEKGFAEMLSVIKPKVKGLNGNTPVVLYTKNNGVESEINEDNMFELQDTTTIYMKQNQQIIDVDREIKELEEQLKKELKKDANKDIGKCFKIQERLEELNKLQKQFSSTNTDGNISKRQEWMDANSLKQAIEDVEQMNLPIPLTIKHFKCGWSQLLYFILWAVDLLNLLYGLKKDKDGYTKDIGSNKNLRRELVDCILSLQQAINKFEHISPEVLIKDAKHISKELMIQADNRSMKLHSMIIEESSNLIDNSTFKLTSPNVIKLYEEQEEILDTVYFHMKEPTDEKEIIGVQTPPSSGKTMQAIGIASMLKNLFPGKKKVLYVCYNVLVQMAVANACEQCDLGYLVVSSAGDRAKIHISDKCLDNSKSAERARQSQTKTDKKGSMSSCFTNAMSECVYKPTIIISDIVSAIELLKLYPNEFILYLDEPTANAEDGMDNNLMQQKIAELLVVSPQLTFLLSATLPDLNKEFKTIREIAGITRMIKSTRLPVGCVAIGPDGLVQLPHQLAENIKEFKSTIDSLKTDALMLRFYTPKLVHDMGREIEKIAKFKKVEIPKELEFDTTFPNLASIGHQSIRQYAKNILNFVATHHNEEFITTVFTILKTFEHGKAAEVRADNFIKDHCKEGMTLAVTTSHSKTINIKSKSECKCDCKDCKKNYGKTIRCDSVHELAIKSIRDFLDKLPPGGAHKFIETFKQAVQNIEKRREAILKAGGKDAVQNAADVKYPVFDWPCQLNGKSGTLSEEEMNTLASNVVSLLLSGIGIYAPETMSQYEINIVLREAVKESSLACLFATPAIVYGTNLPVHIVFIGKGYGFDATRNSLYQLIGRAGRTGVSNKAKILFEDYHTMKRALVSREDDENIEAITMEWHLKNALEKRDIKIAIENEAKIKAEAREIIEREKKAKKAEAQEIIERENEAKKAKAKADAQAEAKAEIQKEFEIQNERRRYQMDNTQPEKEKSNSSTWYSSTNKPLYIQPSYPSTEVEDGPSWRNTGINDNTSWRKETTQPLYSQSQETKPIGVTKYTFKFGVSGSSTNPTNFSNSGN